MAALRDEQLLSMSLPTYEVGDDVDYQGTKYSVHSVRCDDAKQSWFYDLATGDRGELRESVPEPELNFWPFWTAYGDKKVGGSDVASNVHFGRGRFTSPFRTQKAPDQDPGLGLGAKVRKRRKRIRDPKSIRSSPEASISVKYGSVSDGRVSMRALVAELGQRIVATHPQTTAPSNFVSRLTILLEKFSLQLGYEEASTHHRQMMKLLYMYSEQLAQSLEDHLFPRQDGPIMNRGFQSRMTVEEKAYSWIAEEQDFYQFSDATDIDVINVQDEATGLDVDRLKTDSPYFQIMKGSFAFKWLMNHAVSDFGLQQGVADTRAVIMAIIMGLRPKHQLSKREGPPSMSVNLVVNWDLETFITSEADALQLRLSASENEKIWTPETQNIITFDNVGQAITLTGDDTNVQALTCEAYLELVWPSIGCPILKVVREAYMTDDKSCHTYPNKTSVCAIRDGNTCLINIQGEVHALVEVIEIVAWITSTLRSAPSSRPGICAVQPKLQLSDTDHSEKTQVNHEGDAIYQLKLNFEYTSLAPGSNGSCWHDMFNNPVVVLGFPIQRRHKSEVGLEATTAIISTVMQTRRWNLYNSRLYIKAFSAMLVLTKHSKSSLQWHYVHEPQGEHLWFSSTPDHVEHNQFVDPRDLDTHRHFIGWCFEAISKVGAKGDFYAKIQDPDPDLPHPKSSFALKTFGITGGYYGSANLTVALSNKDPSLKIPLAGYGFPDKIRWLAKKWILLWDVDDQRGWLVDGVSGLLHLLRTKLETIWTDELSDTVVLKPNHIAEPDTPNPFQDDITAYPAASIKFFSNRQNMSLPVEIDSYEMSGHEADAGANPNSEFPAAKVKYRLLGHLVDHLIDVLAAAICAPLELAEREGKHFKAYRSEHLDGWNFKALTEPNVRYQPVTLSFDCWTLPWVEFIHSIGAVTLFGAGFGELIEPHRKELFCAHWQKVPTKKNYIATCNATLLKIMQTHKGRVEQNCMQLNKYFTLKNQFDRNPTLDNCLKTQCPSSAELVQAIWHKDAKLPWKRSPLTKHTPLYPSGAILFGNPDRSFRTYVRGQLDNLRKQHSNERLHDSSALLVPEDVQDSEESELSLPIRGASDVGTTDTDLSSSGTPPRKRLSKASSESLD